MTPVIPVSVVATTPTPTNFIAMPPELALALQGEIAAFRRLPVTPESTFAFEQKLAEIYREAGGLLRDRRSCSRRRRQSDERRSWWNILAKREPGAPAGNRRGARVYGVETNCDHTRTTILPLASFDSISRWASWMSSKRNTLAGFAR